MEKLAELSPTLNQETGKKAKIICHEDQGKTKLTANLKLT